MKRERRVELKTNELSVQLQHATEFLRQHGNTVLLSGVGIVLLILAVGYRNYTVAATKELGWTSFYEAPSAGDPNDPAWIQSSLSVWQNIIAEYDEPALQDAAHRRLGQFCLQQVDLTDDVEIRKELLETARASSQILWSRSRNNLPQKATALNWLATIEKTMFTIDGDISHKEKARDFLNQILNGTEFNGTPFQSDVAAQLASFDGLWNQVVFADPPPPPPTPELVPVTDDTSLLPDGDAPADPATTDAEPSDPAPEAGEGTSEPSSDGSN
jgi:hypothetical protein